MAASGRHHIGDRMSIGLYVTRHSLVCGIAILSVTAVARPALAQAPAAAPSPGDPGVGSGFSRTIGRAEPRTQRAVTSPRAPAQSTEPRWELEGYGGFSRGTVSSNGTAALPAAGAPIASRSPLFPARRTPSWFFGDGAAMLNSVSADFGTALLRPLDDALGAPGLDHASAAVLGVRVRRIVNSRYSVEASLDVLPGSGDVSTEFLDAVDATRASFEPAFRGLLSSGPIDVVDISTQLAAGGGSARELAMTGAVIWNIGSGTRYVPYLSFGGGVISGMGDLSAIELEGTYEFMAAVAPGVSGGPFRETDRITIRFERGTSLIGLAGAGVRRALSDRWGFRIDGRVLIGRENSRLLIDANPDVTLRSSGDFIETLTNPSLQFSNDPSTGRRSTLSAPALQGFEVFSGGLQTRTLLTFGCYAGSKKFPATYIPHAEHEKKKKKKKKKKKNTAGSSFLPCNDPRRPERRREVRASAKCSLSPASDPGPPAAAPPWPLLRVSPRQLEVEDPQAVRRGDEQALRGTNSRSTISASGKPTPASSHVEDPLRSTSGPKSVPA